MASRFTKYKSPLVTLTIFTATLAVFLYPKQISSKSGCCSHHGGVDCAAGAQSNGHVICYDGWRGSSCLYSEMVKCGGSSPSTSTYVAPTPTPTLYIPPPTATPVPPTPTPRPPTPTPTKKTTPSPTIIPNSSPTEPIQSSFTPAPTPEGEVLGKTSEEASGSSLGIIAVGALGLASWKFLKKKFKIKVEKIDSA